MPAPNAAQRLIEKITMNGVLNDPHKYKAPHAPRGTYPRLRYPRRSLAADGFPKPCNATTGSFRLALFKGHRP